MSGSYVNNDTRSDTLNNAAAHDSGLYDPNTHDNQIVALYDTMAEANAAKQALVNAGIDGGSVQVMDKSADSMAGGVDYESGNQGFWGAIKSLFVPDEDAHAYSHAIDKGHAMIVVSPSRTSNREQIIHVLEGTNPIDFDAKLEEWRQSGYDYNAPAAGAAAGGAMGAATASTTVNRAAATPVNYAVNQATATDNIPSSAATTGAASSMAGGKVATGTAATRPQATVAAGTDQDTIKVMEERLRVGKREVATGAVRVRSYVVERPVEEQVSLHEERVSIERHPVDRAVTAADAAGAFQDRTIEARATSEEAVVGKDVHVIEEIGLKKEASDRTETVRDTVRKTEVDVEDTSVPVRPTGTTAPSSTNVQGSTSSTSSTAGATTSGMNAPRK